jgi:formate hydrogenlyase subunit 6/NADH:ubiquinone oxidoreductase subunit I/flavodoxin
MLEVWNLPAQVYYFSGTGNSLVVAKDLAKGIDGKLVPMASLIKEKSIAPESDVVGLVFPVYYATNDCGIPLIVGRFVGRLENLGSKYIFGVCTHGGMPGMTIENLKRVVESGGGKLSAGFTVRMSNKKIGDKKQKNLQDKQKKKLEAICEYVNARKEGKFETRGLIRKILLAPLRAFEKPIFKYRYRRLAGTSKNSFSELIPLADASFRTRERCTGCGICAQVCPVNNIKMVDGKPIWLHHCETCYGCYGWCPNNAIYGEIVAYNDWYHNPEVQLSEMLGIAALKK